MSLHTLHLIFVFALVALVFAACAYRFMDFPKAGAPLNLILWIASSVLIPLFWPFVPKS